MDAVFVIYLLNAMAILSLIRGETSIDPYTIEIPLIFPYKKDIFWSYPIFMFILSYSVVCSWYAYYHNSNLKDPT